MGFLSSLFGSPVPSVTAVELNQKLSQGEPLIVLDVREPEEYQSGHIKGAKLIPLGQLNRRAGELPKGKPIVCVCHTGSRSLRATQLLNSAGFQATNLTHGMIAWQRAGLSTNRGGAK